MEKVSLSRSLFLAHEVSSRCIFSYHLNEFVRIVFKNSISFVIDHHETVFDIKKRV